jgi:hypothetical protein
MFVQATAAHDFVRGRIKVLARNEQTFVRNGIYKRTGEIAINVAFPEIDAAGLSVCTPVFINWKSGSFHVCTCVRFDVEHETIAGGRGFFVLVGKPAPPGASG